MPSFNIEEDNIAYQYVKNAFPDCHIHLLEMTEIAKEGGALHCISWNIQRCGLIKHNNNDRAEIDK